jgi:hypothetical protein
MDTARTPDQIRKLLDRADQAMQQGKSRSEVCELLDITDQELVEMVNKYAMPGPQAGANLDNSPLLDAICPVFCIEGEDMSTMEQTGSGVLARIGEEIFLFTAAHVLDRLSTGKLFIPGADGITSLYGPHAFTQPPGNTDRAQDKGDIGYFKLPSPLREQLNPSLKPAGINDLLLTDDLEDGDLFTFAGYPWRKSEKTRNKHVTELFTYTGHAVTQGEYDKLGYSRVVHIAIRLRLKKTFSVRHNSQQIAPHPQGISGGAVLSWPRSLQERVENPNLKLAGIGHSYHAGDNCMAATRIITFLHAVLKNNPQLKEHIPELPA